MAKLPTASGKDAVRVFEQVGFAVVRISGSHHTMKKDGVDRILTVPVHANEDLKPGTLRSLIKNAGITIERFTELL